MHYSGPVLLRARVVLPVVGGPIENGAVLISGNRLVSVGRWGELPTSSAAGVVDLGDVILLPGLINAHCHLDYSGMAGQITPPTSFSDWIKAILALKAHWTYSDFSSSWLGGARMLLKHGTTTVVDVEAVPDLLPEVCTATPLRVCSLLELTSVRSRRPPEEVLQDAIDRISSLPLHANWAGLSPHAPYSTTPGLLRLSADAARRRQWLVATHVAESREEFDMYQHKRGPMFEWLKNQRDMSDCGHGSPVQHLDRHGLLGGRLLAIHVNYLAAGDANLLGRSGASVVHCPRSHSYFGHQPFPRAEFAAAGVNICLGTDSLASVRGARDEVMELDLFAEMRALARTEPGLSPETLLRLATVHSARALGMTGEIGELSSGALADLITIPFAGRTEAVWEAIVGQPDPVGAVMIDGQWALQPVSL
jgi:aminodeoxyfutalosine deaminase